MFWEPHLLTLRVNANSVNAAATAEDEDEMRMRPRVESSELSSGRMAKRCPPGGYISGLEEEGSGIQGEERGVSKKVDFLLENP